MRTSVKEAMYVAKKYVILNAVVTLLLFCMYTGRQN